MQNYIYLVASRKDIICRMQNSCRPAGSALLRNYYQTATSMGSKTDGISCPIFSGHLPWILGSTSDSPHKSWPRQKKWAGWSSGPTSMPRETLPPWNLVRNERISSQPRKTSFVASGWGGPLSRKFFPGCKRWVISQISGP